MDIIKMAKEMKEMELLESFGKDLKFQFLPY